MAQPNNHSLFLHPFGQIMGRKMTEPTAIKRAREKQRENKSRVNDMMLCACVRVDLSILIYLYVCLNIYSIFFEQVNGEFITACDHDDTVNILRNAGKS